MRLLHDLLDLAVKENLFSAFQPVTVHAKLVISADGSARIDAFEKKSQRIEAPVVQRSGTVVRPYKGYDNEEYSLGIVLDKERSAARFEAYWAQTEEFIRASGDHKALAAVQAVMGNRRWLTTARAEIKKFLAKAKAKSQSPHVMLALALEDGLLLERPRIREYFERSLQSSMNDEEGPDTCLVTGRKCNAVVLHDGVQGVPGTGGNFPLISFNQTTSTQGGLEQGFNFPVSPYAMKGFTAAANYIVARNRFNISPSTSGVLWGPSEAPAIAKVIGNSRQEDLQQAWATLESLSGSKEPLHVLFLKGSQGRLAILSYSTVPTGKAVTSLLRFRNHFGTSTSEPSVIGRLRAVTASTGNTKDNESRQILDAMTRVRTIETLLNGEPVPADVYSRIIHALSPSNLMETDRESNKAARKAAYYAALCQLAWFEFVLSIQGIKIPTTRRTWFMTTTEEPKVEQFVIPRSPGAVRMDEYFIGRLIAIEEEVRRQAHKRSMGGASSLPLASINPAVWYEDHFRRMRTYEEKLARRGIHGTIFTKQASEVITELQNLDLFTRSSPFTSIGRASLCLGYDHQRAFNKAHRRWSYEKKTPKHEGGTEDKAAE